MDKKIFEKINSKKKTTLIADQILKLIKSKKLSVGEKLPSERFLAESMGVSRGALRETLRALEMIGIVETRVGDGSYIKGETAKNKSYEVSEVLEREDNPLNVIMVRKRIEPLSVKLAARNVNSENIKPLEEIINEAEENLNNEEINYEIDGRFHLAIARMTENKTLIDVMKVIVDRMADNRFWRYGKEKSIKEFRELKFFTYEHKDIFNAIKTGDSELAEKLVLKHLNDVEKGLKRLF